MSHIAWSTVDNAIFGAIWIHVIFHINSLLRNGAILSLCSRDFKTTQINLDAKSKFSTFAVFYNSKMTYLSTII